MKSEALYVRHVLEAIQKIESYLGDTDFEKFSDNDMMIDAVARELEIIGEAAGQCGEAFKKSNPEVKGKEAIGMRNRLIHEFFGVDLSVVWTTCKEDLPFLKAALMKIKI